MPGRARNWFLGAGERLVGPVAGLRLAACAVIFLLVASAAALAREGDLAASFNHGRAVWVSDGPLTSLAGVARQRDGKVVVVGGVGDANARAFQAWLIERFLPNGQLDRSFGTRGVVKLPLGQGFSASAVALQRSSQRILIGGTAYSSGRYGVEFVRLNPNGSLDTSFGRRGMVFLSRPGVVVGQTFTIALDAKGNAYLAGRVVIPLFPVSHSKGLIASVTSSGRARAWAPGGILVPDLSAAGSDTVVRSVAVSGRTVFYVGCNDCSRNSSRALIGAVNSSTGKPVRRFGAGGLFRLSAGVGLLGLLVAADGKLKATGFSAPSGSLAGALIASFRTTGADPIDRSFGHRGQVVVGGRELNDPLSGEAITEQSGRVFVAALAVGPNQSHNYSNQIALVAVDEATGAPDRGLGPQGFRLYSVGALSYAAAITDADGYVEIAGSVEPGPANPDQGLLMVVETAAAHKKHQSGHNLN